MTWNYRVIKKAYMGETSLGIHEVYYDDDDKPEMVTVEAVGAVGDDLKDLTCELMHMLAALDKPVLNYEDIP